METAGEEALGANTVAPAASAEVIRLRYAGTCELCGARLPARTEAIYDRARKKVRCVNCPTGAERVEPHNGTDEPLEPVHDSTGQAGASAHREYERRFQRREARVRAAVERDAAWREHVKEQRPVLGRVQAALTPRPVVGPVPQHIKAWEKGAEGERQLGSLLHAWAAGGGGAVLHDRRIPGTKANIDHIAVAPSGVWVIDAKAYNGLVERVDVGSFFRSDVRLRVAGRDKSKLPAGVGWQMERVVAALDSAAAGSPRPPVFGMLAFIGADWKLFARPFVFDGVTVAWPRAVIKTLAEEGPWTAEQMHATAAALAAAFPPA